MRVVRTEGDLRGSMSAICGCQLLFQNTHEDQACLNGRQQQGYYLGPRIRYDFHEGNSKNIRDS